MLATDMQCMRNTNLEIWIAAPLIARNKYTNLFLVRLCAKYLAKSVLHLYERIDLL